MIKHVLFKVDTKQIKIVHTFNWFQSEPANSIEIYEEIGFGCVWKGICVCAMCLIDGYNRYKWLKMFIIFGRHNNSDAVLCNQEDTAQNNRPKQAQKWRTTKGINRWGKKIQTEHKILKKWRKTKTKVICIAKYLYIYLFVCLELPLLKLCFHT